MMRRPTTCRPNEDKRVRPSDEKREDEKRARHRPHQQHGAEPQARWYASLCPAPLQLDAHGVLDDVNAEEPSRGRQLHSHNVNAVIRRQVSVCLRLPIAHGKLNQA